MAVTRQRIAKLEIRAGEIVRGDPVEIARAKIEQAIEAGFGDNWPVTRWLAGDRDADLVMTIVQIAHVSSSYEEDAHL